jgi:hypothetical protein
MAALTCPRCGNTVTPTTKECGVCRLPLAGVAVAGGAPSGPPPGAGGPPPGAGGPPPGVGGPPPGAGGPPPGVGGPPAGAMKMAQSPIMKPKFLAIGTGLTWALVETLPGFVASFTTYSTINGAAPKFALFILMVPVILLAAAIAVGQYFIANIPVPVFGEQWRTACAVLLPISVFVAVAGFVRLISYLGY